jgi:hypothetical protein
MASALDDLREDRPAYVRFERVGIEDTAETLKQGVYIARDVDMALITPPYSKDVMKYKVKAWFDILDQDVRNGRIPEAWVANYKKQYAAFKAGQEMPLNGSPIKGWGIISPAQQEMLIRMQVLTVEDLAAINDEGMKQMGLGGLDLKNKAKAWLLQINDHGKLAIQMADLQKKFATQEALINDQNDKLELLKGRLSQYEDAPKAQIIPITTDNIGVADILDDEVEVKVSRKKG